MILKQNKKEKQIALFANKHFDAIHFISDFLIFDFKVQNVQFCMLYFVL